MSLAGALSLPASAAAGLSLLVVAAGLSLLVVAAALFAGDVVLGLAFAGLRHKLPEETRITRRVDANFLKNLTSRSLDVLLLTIISRTP